MGGPLDEAKTRPRKRSGQRTASARPAITGAGKPAAGPQPAQRADLNVVVLGMHRSGTSAVAQALRAGGFSTGSDAGLMVPEQQNPAGFGELLSIALFNDRLLGSLEWFWDAPDASPLANPPARPEYVAEGVALVDRELVGPQPFVLKDPRISLLLPWWRRILFDRFVPIVVMRDPVEVAWSLRVRDGLPMELGLAIHAAYYRHLAAGLDGLAWIGVDFGTLCERPRPTLSTMLRALSRLGVDAQVDTRAAARAIRPLLRRATQPTDASMAQNLIPALEDLRRQSPAGGVVVAKQFEPIARPTGWETAILNTYRRSREAGARTEAARATVRELEARLADAGAGQAQLESVADNVRGELADALRDRDAARAALGDREARLLALDIHHAEQAAHLEALARENADQLRAVTADRVRLDEQLVTLIAGQGEFEAQVASLNSERAQLEGQLETMASERTQLETQLETMASERALLEAQVASLTSDRAQLETQLETMASERALLEDQVASLTSDRAQPEAQARTVASGHARAETEQRARIEGAEREQDGPRAVAARRSASPRFSLRSMARGLRRSYRRALVQLPPSVVGVVWHNPLFDTEWYLEQNPDVRETRLGPEAHFRRHGAAERRRPNRLFDTTWYLEHNPDVAASQLNPLDHYLLFGADEGRSPSAAFDTAWYLAANPDVAASGMNPLLHYLHYGRLEGRSPSSQGRAQIADPAPSAGMPASNKRLTSDSARPGPTEAAVANLYPQPQGAGDSNGRWSEASSTREAEASYDAAEAVPVADDVRLIAFYRSTYYADNLSANGSGGSEWLTVASARPTVAGQRQPHVPRDLGFYDLRLPETRRHQAELARRYGIYAFCYDETWGHPDRHTRPFREMLRSGEPDFSFTLRMTLDSPLSAARAEARMSADWLAQNLAQLTSALETLADPRAVRVGNDPLFVVEGIDGAGAPLAAEAIRKQARRVGLPGVFLAVPVTISDQPESAGSLGVDSLLEVHPDPALLPRSGRKSRPRPARPVAVASYEDYARRARAVAATDRLPSVLVGWDDTPLDGRGRLVLTDATPEAYGQWLRSAVATARDTLARERRLVFVTSWNDWARGAHLEPDVLNGRAYLESTRACLVAPVLSLTTP